MFFVCAKFTLSFFYFFTFSATIRWSIAGRLHFLQNFYSLRSEKKRKTFSAVVRQIDWVVFGEENLHRPATGFSHAPRFHCQSKATRPEKGHETLFRSVNGTKACTASAAAEGKALKPISRPLHDVCLGQFPSSNIPLHSLGSGSMKQNSISFQIVKLKHVFQQIID